MTGSDAASQLLRQLKLSSPLVGRFVALEPLGSQHAAGLVTAAAEGRDTFAHTWVPDGIDDAERYIATALAQQATGKVVPFVQRRLADGVICGSTRFMNIETWSWDEGDGMPDAAEIGSTWLSASAQRTTINTEAKLLLLRHVFEVWHVQRLWIKTDALNTRSRTAIERLGARFEGILRNHLPAVGRPGPRDTASYSIIPPEWPEVRAGLERRLVMSSGLPQADEPIG
ncbi:MAG: GNAT family N-acetyltransferase [Acidimicrobiia bacterium]